MYALGAVRDNKQLLQIPPYFKSIYLSIYLSQYLLHLYLGLMKWDNCSF